MAYGVRLLLFIIYLVAGLMLVHVVKGRFDKTKKVLFVAGMAVLLRFCYGRGRGL